MSTFVTINSTYTASVTLTNSAGTPITNATVTGALYQSNRTTAVTGASSITFSHTSGGVYTATLAASVTTLLVRGRSYYLKSTAVLAASAGQQEHWQELIARYDDD